MTFYIVMTAATFLINALEPDLNSRTGITCVHVDA